MQKPKRVYEREQDIFISHASKDKHRAVDSLRNWLRDTCGLRIWYDRDMLVGGDRFTSELADAITKCRAMIIVMSEASLKSAWVDKEVEFALDHQAEFREFKVIPVLLDNVEPPGFLRTLNYIPMPNGELTLDFCDALLTSLYPRDMSLLYGTNRDLYASVSWRPEESDFTNIACQYFAQADFRLVGDSKDQRSFMANDPHRIENIVSSCGGLIAVLPYRAEEADFGFTSKYMLAEIALAQQFDLPYVVVAQTKVMLPESVTKGALRVIQLSAGEIANNPAVTNAIEALDQAWKPPIKPHYIFYSTSFDHQDLLQAVRKMIQSITGLRCMIGQEIEGNSTLSVPQAIINMIKGAFLVIADISRDEESAKATIKTMYERSIQSDQPFDSQDIKKLTDALAINTLIEVGAARGADVQYRLIAQTPRRSPPFMLGDLRDVPYYSNEVELLGITHKLTYPFRRRIINHELRKL